MALNWPKTRPKNITFHIYSNLVQTGFRAGLDPPKRVKTIIGKLNGFVKIPDMPNYTLAYYQGGTYFFTANLLERRRRLLVDWFKAVSHIPKVTFLQMGN